MAESLAVLRWQLGRRGWQWDALDGLGSDVGVADTTGEDAARLAACTAPGTADTLLWEAANTRLDAELELLRRSVGAPALALELAVAAWLRGELAARCRGRRPQQPVSPTAFDADPEGWRSGLGRALRIDLCAWYGFGARTLPNFEAEAAVSPRSALSPVVALELGDVAAAVWEQAGLRV